MIRTNHARHWRIALATASALTACPAWADAPAPAVVPAGQSVSPDLADQFRDPPNSARPRVWWHWMNGNITKDGIAKDMAWMKSVGIGGLQNFDVNLMTPQIVEHRLAYMTPEWKDAFRFAASEADRLGLELAIASSPGWSETGGPWVTPADALKKLVWSETNIPAGKAFKGRLAAPPSTTGPFQTLAKPMGLDDIATGEVPKAGPVLYGDIAVLAVPDMGAGDALPKASLGNGQAVDAARLQGGDLMHGIDIPRGTADAPASVTYTYATPQTIRSASFFLPGAKVMFSGATVAPVIEASDDGKAWRKVADLPPAEVPTTISFASVTARQFRLVLNGLPFSMSNMGAPAEGIFPPPMFAGLAGNASAPWALREFRLSGEARVDQYEAKAGFALAMDYFALATPGDHATGPAAAQVIDITSHMQADGTLDWTAPRLPNGGHWRVLRLGHSLLGTTNHPAPAEATGLEVDKFDGAAVTRYMDHYLAMYRDAAGPGMLGAHGVRAILTDSIEVGAANWTPRLIEQFKAHRGYDPTPWLPTLAGVLIGGRADADKFLYDWRRTLAELMASEHYGTVARIAHAAGLKVYGEALEDKRPSLGDDMAMRTHTDIPMSAMWTFPRGGTANPSFVADIKGAASVAHIYGQNLVAAESMTSALNYWADSPQTLKHVIDLEFVTGVNRPVVHTSVHQPVDDKVPGLSLLIFGQFFNRHEAWAPLAKAWVDYISRNALMLQQGRNVADVGYFYGEEAPLTGLYGLKPVEDAPRTHAYDFVNADALAGALSNDGADIATSGGARYRALYLGGSSRHMTLAALRRIAALVEGGATVVGHAPQGTPSMTNGTDGEAAEYRALVAKLWPGAGDAQVGKGRVIASDTIESALDTMGVAPDFRMTGGAADADVPFVHRRWAEGEAGDSYFLVNRQMRREQFDAHFRITGKVPELWHAETGTFEPVSYRIANGETVVPMTLNSEESVHIVFRKPATAMALTVAKPAAVSGNAIKGPWKVSFQAGRGAPASITLPELQPLNAQADAGVKYFSGVATYAIDVAGPKRAEHQWLNLGQVNELAEVVVNGQTVGTVWHAPYRLDIGKALKPGKLNHIEIRVANLWVNRLIGDAQPAMQQPGAQKITFTALPTYRADAPLRPSGLIGPVTLEGQGQ